MYLFVLWTQHGSQLLYICPWYNNAEKINENAHADMPYWHFCVARALASPARSKETIDHCIWRVSYWARTATQYELWQFQFPKHALYHHFDIVQNTRRSYLLWGTWRALWYMAASSFPAFNRPRKGLYLHTRFDVELFMWAQGNALWWQCSLCHS